MLKDFPVTAAQQRMWIMAQYEGGSQAYNMAGTLLMKGELCHTSINLALADLIGRHEGLRTVFRFKKEELRQLILPAKSFQKGFVYHDLRQYTEPEKELKKLIQTAATAHIDLSEGPLFKCTLARLSDNRHAAILAIHHIISDGWSLAVLEDDLLGLYAAHLKGTRAKLYPISTQYRDFAAQQEAQLQTGKLVDQANYWRDRFSGSIPQLELPKDRPRPAKRSFKGAFITREVPPVLVTSLKKLARQEGNTLFTVLMASVNALLYRYTGQSDLMVGIPVAGRRSRQLFRLVGFFANTVVLRNQVHADLTFRELLNQVRTTSKEALQNQDYPFDRVLTDLDLASDHSRNPLFDVMVALDNVGKMQRGLAATGAELGLEINRKLNDHQGAMFDLWFGFSELNDQLVLNIQYSQDLFDQWRIEQMRGHLLYLLEQICADPSSTIASLELMHPIEKRQVLTAFNPSSSPWNGSGNLVESFTETVRKFPDQTALVIPEDQVSGQERAEYTYSELHQNAQKIAALLRNNLGSEDKNPTVALMLDRSEVMVSAILGTMMAGAAYLPVDPAFPKQRRDYMLEDAGVHICLTTSQYEADFENTACRSICLDQQSSFPLPSSLPDPNPQAYLMYTSGSSGRPKGVMIGQKALMNLLQSMAQSPGFTHADRLLSVTTYSFDISVLEFFLPLITGGTLILANTQTSRDPILLAKCIEDEQPTLIQATPSRWQMLLETGWKGNPNLRLLTGGEAIDLELAERLHTCGKELWNMYGPTETTIWSTCGLLVPGENIHVGSPISNTEVLMLDSHNQLVPIGMAGEVCIAGSGLADGYLNQPELTADRFVFHEETGKTIYRTGDLGRWRPDGRLEIMGRIDQQVKLRGFRIELSEIESVLSQSPSVSRAAVKLHPQRQQLVAFLQRNDAWFTETLRRQLKENTPAQTSAWASLFDEAYEDESTISDPLAHFGSWLSSYTGDTYPVEHMRSWTERAVSRIRSLNPDRVLEVGCGTGLLLLRLASETSYYLGVDIADAGLQHIVKAAASINLPPNKFDLHKLAAHQVNTLPLTSFDTVVVNSVAQYFPDQDYFHEFIVDSLKLLTPGGKIFLGDIRALALVELFETETHTHRANPELELQGLRKQIRSAIAADEELCADPRFFFQIACDHEVISMVEILPKQFDNCENEMTKFRYDAILHTEKVSDSAELSWYTEETKTELETLLQEADKKTVFVLEGQDIPNLSRAMKLLQGLSDLPHDLKVSDLNRFADAEPGSESEPQQVNVIQIAEQNGYECKKYWAQHDLLGKWDLVFFQPSHHSEKAISFAYYQEMQHRYADFTGSVANLPGVEALANTLISDLRKLSLQYLPEYMVPGAFTWMAAFPETANGKLDRKALRMPEDSFADEGIFPAQNETETSLIEIWESILGVSPLGRNANFFDLGGHSLKATRMLSVIHKEFGIQLPLRHVFKYPVLFQLARQIGAADPTMFLQIEPLSNQAHYATSKSQQRMWVLSQFESGSAAYNISGRFQITGDLDTDKMARASELLIARHESLRTGFFLVGGELRQKIYSPEQILDVFEYEDLSQQNVSFDDVKNLASQEAMMDFDLENGPLLRLHLIRTEVNHHVLIMTIHHIVSDGWSVDVLEEELFALYGELRSGEKVKIPTLPVQYKDFASWHNDQLDGGFFVQQKTYWQQQLSGELPVMDLPLDRPRPQTQQFQGAMIDFDISDHLYQKMKELAKDQGMTLFMLLLAGLKTLLYRYSGQKDILVALPVAGRRHQDLERLVGNFVNTLVFRSQLKPENSFLEFLGEVQQTSLDGFEHQDYPFDQVVDDLKIPRTLNRNPIFDTMLAFENVSAAKLSAVNSATATGLEVERFANDNDAAMFDLWFGFTEGDEELSLSIQYDTSIFDEWRIEQMGEHFLRLLESIVRNPNLPLDAFPYLSGEEKQQLLHGFNATEIDYPLDTTLADMFEDQVKQHPEKIALVQPIGKATPTRKTFTFSQLNSKADHLFQRINPLLPTDQQPIVGIIMDRSPKMVIAILAILKAGGAYVPIDLKYPSARVDFMIGDSQMDLCLYDGCQPPYQEITSVPMMDVSESQEISGKSEQVPSGRIRSANDLAYILYTSGSTGTPKGCELEHRGVINRILWQQQALGFDLDDRILQKTTYVFDVSVWEIFMPLCLGMRMVLCPTEDMASPERIKEISSTEGVTTLHFVPSMFEAFLAKISQSSEAILPDLKRVICSGEALALHAVHDFHSKFNVDLHNLYGPTEASVDVTWFSTKPDTDRVLIGAPIANTSIYILDKGMQPVPIGVAGEIYIGGVQLARGYRNRPEQNRTRFLKNPFTGEGRLYRTGDLGIRTRSGEVEYLGRNDSQVKIRGFRIELGEIEAYLVQNLNVQAAVVLPFAQDQQLAAYLLRDEKWNDNVSGEPSEADLSEILKRTLKTELPEYMVPAAYIWMNEFPITANGKLDRQGFPLPETTINIGEQPEQPTTETEIVLARIWEEVLGISNLERNANFFVLGGHSIKTIKVIGKLRDVLGIELPFREVFDYPVLSELALRIEEKAPTAQAMITRVARMGDYPLSPGQLRLWILSQFDPDNESYNIPGALEIAGVVDPELLNKAFLAIMERHESLRTVFRESESGPKQVLLPLEELDFSLETTDLRQEANPEEAAMKYAVEIAKHPFDLKEGPLIRARLLVLEQERFMLLVTMHHIVSDGWSLGILVRDVVNRYQFFLNSEVPELPILPAQYIDFSHWQFQRLQSKDMQAHESYWLSELEKPLPVLEFPTDRARPSIQTFNGGSFIETMPEDLTIQLRDFAGKANSTLFTVLVAGIKALLYRYTGQKDLILGVPVHGRVHPDLREQIGMYINTVALRSQIDPESDLSGMVNAVRNRLMEADEHQEYPFDELVRKISPERDLSRSPIFDIMVDFQSDMDAEFKDLAPFWEISPFEAEWEYSKFDFSIDFVEHKSELKMRVEYNTDLFDAWRIREFVQNLNRLLAAWLVEPQLEIGKIDFLGQENRSRIVDQLRGTALESPHGHFLDYFEAAWKRTPDATALQFEDEIFSYSELRNWSLEIAHQIRTQHPDCGNAIGVWTRRKPATIAAILACFHLNAAYVPIDPGYPQDRVAYMVEDASVKLVLADESETGIELPSGVHLQPISALSLTNIPAFPVRDSSSAYIIYTSGTAGKPKGVEISHTSVANLCQAMIHAFEMRPGDRLLQFAALSFDMSVEEVFPILAVGGTLVLRGETWIDSPATFVSECNKRDITLLNLPTGFWGLLLEEMVSDQLQIPACVRLLSVGAERIPLSALHTWKKLEAEKPRLFNAYGPTEGTANSTVMDLDVWDGAGRYVPIGKPLANLQAFISDPDGNQVPEGVYGELLLAGPQLAKAYLHHPDETKAQFVYPDFANGLRCYKTGDRAYFLDGVIYCAGRIDQQLKIRGYRIEPGELESVLLELPGISAAVVFPLYENEAVTGLGACLEGNMLERSKVLNHLTSRFPDYMIPRRWLHIERFPRNSRGKIDRPTLLEELLMVEISGSDGTPPETKTEMRLATIWEEILELKEIVREDHFFALGGHSLKATRVIARLEKQTGKRVPLSYMFRYPILKDLAEQLELIAETAHDEVPKAPDQPDYPLSPAQRSLWLASQIRELSVAYNMPGSFSIQGQVDVKNLETALYRVVARHEILRTVFQLMGNEPRMLIVQPEDCKGVFEFADLQGMPHLEAEIAAFSARDAAMPFDLENGPLLRLHLLQTAPERYVLLFNMHHLITDGWSMLVLLEDLIQTYIQPDNPLPEMRLQYRDYAVWKTELAKAPVAKKVRQFWLNEFAQPVPPLKLPYRLQAQQEVHGRGNMIPLRINPQDSDGLDTLCREEGVSPYMLSLALYQMTLSAFADQDDIVVVSPYGGRSRTELEGQIGYYINTFSVRMHLEPDLSFTAFLAALKTKVLQIYDHEDWPMSLLSEDPEFQRTTQRSGLFDYGFTLHNQPDDEMEKMREYAPELQIEVLDGGIETSKADFWLHQIPTDQYWDYQLSHKADCFVEGFPEAFVKGMGKTVHLVVENPDINLTDLAREVAEEYRMEQISRRNSIKGRNLKSLINRGKK